MPDVPRHKVFISFHEKDIEYNMMLLLPPLAEQSAIAAHPDNTAAGIDAARANARRRIELPQEYRARLIADAVSCKPDVREAADRGAPIPDNGSMKGEAIEGKVTA